MFTLSMFPFQQSDSCEGKNCGNSQENMVITSHITVLNRLARYEQMLMAPVVQPSSCKSTQCLPLIKESRSSGVETI